MIWPEPGSEGEKQEKVNAQVQLLLEAEMNKNTVFPAHVKTEKKLGCKQSSHLGGLTTALLNNKLIIQHAKGRRRLYRYLKVQTSM